MKLILAQGNPSYEYEKSRHNIGFLALDSLSECLGAPKFQNKSKFHSKISEFELKGEKIILAKPMTYYNLTGRSAQLIASFYQISADNILVIHDDLTLEFGKIRVRLGGSDGGNNGIKSLSNHLGQGYWRLKIGTKNDLKDQMSDADFVLAKLSNIELKSLEESIFPEVNKVIKDFVSGDIEASSKNLIS